ncbi:MAG: spondin domain-containing protein [Pseudomonadota bacterium]
MTIKRKGLLAASAAALACLAVSSAHAVPITVSIKNNSEIGGLNLTPLFVAFHNNSYDAFDVGSAASQGTERVAELGATMQNASGTILGATEEALAADPNAIVRTFGAPSGFGGAPIIEPGETATITLDLSATDHRYFNYLSMIIPSNDTFIGNDNAIEIFNPDGSLKSGLTFDVTGNNIWDAGTEVNDFTDGPAFVVSTNGQAIDATGGTEENGIVRLSDGLGILNGQLIALPTGANVDTSLVDFVSDRTNFSLATISIVGADPVPLPAAAPFMALALGVGAAVRRQRKGKKAISA